MSILWSAIKKPLSSSAAGAALEVDFFRNQIAVCFLIALHLGFEMAFLVAGCGGLGHATRNKE